MKLRYVDQGIHILELRSNDHYVRCTQCHSAGVLKYKKRDDLNCCCYHKEQFIFHCRSCGFYLDTHDPTSEHRLNGTYYVNRSEQCHRCGGATVSAESKISDIKHPPPFIEAKCSLCHSISKLSVKTSDIRYRPNYTHRIGQITIFGLELYLCVATRFGQIFVYNLEHLNILKDYIQADLRERLPNVGNGYYFNCLPAWIKSARNRKEILKAILRLEQMASNIQPSTKK